MKPSELLSDASKWCRDHTAETISGFPVASEDEQAVRWCIIGATIKCGTSDKDVKRLLIAAGGSISNFNDTHTFEECRQLLIQNGL